ncbi:diguanylate cyclase (GGDEF) domain-containing protein [Allochromatium warmingii]|uniref:diguanylate cyclase n=1 Tax=Allochromatium warmingii TaxID=61595 RepID=A0A1H3K6C7_ALLWA|nr:GGDEF domain-containing protein [Allochromatium warmingii]SDY47760.1 diguanylate cyclase (GGDEF) domain-containing protein [Allochromatium warmingii]
MNLNRKVTLLFVALAASILIALVIISLYAFRSFALNSSTAHVKTAAEIVRVHLTEAMINGTINKREQFLERLMEVQGLSMARVIRSPLVSQQFGEGLQREMVADRIETQVLQDGQPRFSIIDEIGEPVFRGTIPYIASSRGTPNCLQCHRVQEGDVLGAVTIELLLSGLRKHAMTSVIGIMITVAVFSLLAITLARRLVLPVGDTATEIGEVVQRALKGQFKARVTQRTTDDVGMIAAHVNRLLEYLDHGLSSIVERVAQLTGRMPSGIDNQLETTIDMVNSLADAATFKITIEEDETKAEIYERFGQLLTKRFGICEYSLYETRDTGHLQVIKINGDENQNCLWCNPQILIRSEHCRARRAGHVVDGLTQEHICAAFVADAQGGEVRQHYCVPIIQSGVVGAVVQLVTTQTIAPCLALQVPYILMFIREMAPVLEAKRLTETLRESSLQDVMTGLHNRRFLEEYVETLVATAKRRHTVLAILLLDLDYFKMVNDTHGHDAGDAVLKGVAELLKQNVRSSDLVIRFGGEEFLILLPDTNGEMAVKVAEKIRLAVEQYKFRIAGGELKKTISVGVALFPEDSETFWQTLKYADVALYRAKETGRNRVLRFAPEMWHDENDGY